jgi:hypothetical protein
MQVGKTLRDAPLQRIGARAADVGAVLAGLAAVLAAGGADPDPVHAAAGAAGLAAGLWLGLSTRTAAGAAVAADEEGDA